MNTIAVQQERTTHTDKDKYQYVLHLADDLLILSHRNSEWCGHGPVLEQDIAITNITLDLIGQARNLYQYAASMAEGDATEDTIAYLRREHEYLNSLLTEQPKGDWAVTTLRQFLYSTYQFLLFDKLQYCDDAQLAAIAAKALKEITYHVRWSSEWVIRLGDGTEDSHNRMLQAIDRLWMYTGELFLPASYEKAALVNGFGADLSAIRIDWVQKVHDVFDEARLPFPETSDWVQQGGKQGRHTEHMGYILAELQYMQRTYPGCNW